MTDTTSTAEARQRLIGIGFIVLGAMALGCVDGFSKVLAPLAHPAQIVWARYVMALPFLLLTNGARLPTLFTTANMRMQILRGLTPLAISFGMVIGVHYLPLAEATVILFLAPLLIVALSGPLLGERVHRASWWAVAVGFVAVLVVARPGFSALSQFTIFPLVGAIFYALLQIVTRYLANRGERPTTTLAWTLLVGAIATTPIALVFWQPLQPAGWLFMLALGTCFGIGQLALIAGLAHAPAALAAPLSYVQIIAAVIFGLIAFGELPDLWTFVGILTIVAAGLYVVRLRNRT